MGIELLTLFQLYARAWVACTKLDGGVTYYIRHTKTELYRTLLVERILLPCTKVQWHDDDQIHISSRSRE